MNPDEASSLLGIVVILAKLGCASVYGMFIFETMLISIRIQSATPNNGSGWLLRQLKGVQKTYASGAFSLPQCYHLECKMDNNRLKEFKVRFRLL